MTVTKPASIWLKTFAVGFAVVSAMLVVTLFTPAPYGDLSRIGRLSDAEFGWRAPPPPAPTDALHGTPIEQADILVVGDSFSMTYYWQAQLVQAGYRVATVYWGQFGYMCQDFSAWATQAGFKGKLVIVESVERLLDERLRKGIECKTMIKAPVAKIAPFFKSFTEVPAPALNWSAKLTTGIETWRNTRRAKKTDADTLYGKDTQVRRVPDGCKQFSHKQCDRALFFKDDVDNGPLTAETFALLERYNRSQSLPLLWMVIPNKTTVYIDQQHSKPFVDAFRGAGLGPDLFLYAQDSRMKVRDFYFPNDTHISMHGQLALGDTMLAEVRKRVPTLPARAP